MKEKAFEIENSSGPEINEMRLRYKTDCSGSHYSEYMFSGPQILTFAMDALTDFSVRRDDGDGSLDANINVNFHSPLYGGDTIEQIMWVIKEGRRSRVYGFKVYKIVERIKGTDSCKVLNPPVLVCNGESTTVIKKPREEQEKKF